MMKKVIFWNKIFLLISLILMITNWNNMLFQQVDENHIVSLDLEIVNLYSADRDLNLSITVNSRGSVTSVIEMEDFICRSAGVCVLEKTAHWKIIINYNSDTGQEIRRFYEGQHFQEELKAKLLTIKEVRDALNKAIK